MLQINKAIDRDVTVNHHVLDQEKKIMFSIMQQSEYVFTGD